MNTLPPPRAPAAALALLLLAHAAALAAPAPPPPLPRAAPAALGLAPERLARIDAMIEQEIAAHRKAGAVVLIARHGKVGYFKAYGEADAESHRRMRTDDLFRLLSMTKPVTSVALLTLYEQGKFQLSEPLDKYIPEFKHVRVYKGTGPNGEMELEDPKRPITIEDVFRHTAGFSYGYFSDTPVDRAYRESGVVYSPELSLKAFTEKLATMPLLYQPGTHWYYGFAHEVQARLVEILSGMPFDAYCQKVIFGPLGMKDTVFGVPESLAPRFAKIYHPDKDGRILPGDSGNILPGVGRPGDAYAAFTGHPYGGASLSSTPGDYLRFAQMLLNGGQLDGQRILSRKTVELMTADHLGASIPPLSPGVGYGLGVGVVTDPAQQGALGSRGEYFWGGYATTSVLIDPQEQLIALFFAQLQPGDYPLRERFQTLVYQSIAD